MADITGFLKNELYPAIYESIDKVFPEHNFKRFSNGWRSNTYLDGRPHNRSDKTVITKNKPHLILEQGGEVLSIVDYVMRRDNVDFITAVKTLCNIVGYNLPNNVNTENYQKYKLKNSILEECNNYFIKLLTTSNETKEYLYSRGYTDDDIEGMELGYIGNINSLKKHLLDKGYTEELIKEIIKFPSGVGITHNLTIPYRVGGILKGFKFRTINNDIPKYLNSIGLDKSEGFFNISGLKGNKDLVIVEGELDALFATVKGVDNVVAMAGSSITSNQIKDAVKRGVQKFTLCFDREPDREEETNKKINNAIDIFLNEGVYKVYIATLPDLGEKTDVDRLIKEQGVDIFKECIRKAIIYYLYKMDNIFDKYAKIEEENGDLSRKQIDDLVYDIVKEGALIPDLIDRNIYINNFMALSFTKDYGITEKELSMAMDRLTFEMGKDRQRKDLVNVISEATKLINNGDFKDAIELIDVKIKDIKLIDKITEFSKLMVPTSEKDIKNRLSSRQEDLRSGYKIGINNDYEDLLLPSGAISIFAAPTSHGKTSLLINLILNVAKEYKDKEFYFFSYEEDKDSVIMKTLNTYIDKDISKNNRKSIRSYFATGSTKYINKDYEQYFISEKDKFFRDFIDTKRINIYYSDYNSDMLSDAIRYLHKNGNPGAIFIDYIQLLYLPSGKYKAYSRQEELKQICISLKDVAVETGLPIILGAQFNREVVNLLKIHPTKIGEAGDIERVANLIVGFWNNKFEGICSEGEQADIARKLDNHYNTETLYVTILKNRDWKAGIEEILSFNGNTGKIKNIDNDKDSPF